MKQTALFLFLVMSGFVLSAQNNNTASGNYDPHDLFAKDFDQQQPSPYRSAKGVPGPSYWQNSASYLIHSAGRCS